MSLSDYGSWSVADDLCEAAGAAMYERSGSESNTSLDTDSKSNENEAALVVAHVESLVRHLTDTLFTRMV